MLLSSRVPATVPNTGNGPQPRRRLLPESKARDRVPRSLCMLPDWQPGLRLRPEGRRPARQFITNCPGLRSAPRPKSQIGSAVLSFFTLRFLPVRARPGYQEKTLVTGPASLSAKPGCSFSQACRFSSELKRLFTPHPPPRRYQVLSGETSQSLPFSTTMWMRSAEKPQASFRVAR